MDGHLPLEGQLVTTERRGGGWRGELGVGIAAPTATFTAPLSPARTTGPAAPTASPLLLIWLAVVEGGHVDNAGISPDVFGEGVTVLGELVGLEVHFGLEDNKLALEAFRV